MAQPDLPTITIQRFADHIEFRCPNWSAETLMLTARINLDIIAAMREALMDGFFLTSISKDVPRNEVVLSIEADEHIVGLVDAKLLETAVQLCGDYNGQEPTHQIKRLRSHSAGDGV